MAPSDPNVIPDAQIDDTTEKQHTTDNIKTQCPTENYEDPSGRLLSMYLAEAKKEDNQMTKNWTEDTQGVLVFTGLFSAIIAAFITMSLPRLSPDSGAQTVALLTQLVNISTGAPVIAQNTPFEAPASIIRVNVLWILSLILSLSCALLATLMQQWARRYLDYAQRRGEPIMRLLIRAYILDEVEKFGMSQVVEMMPLILHTSVFLFLAGFVDFLFTINKVVAFSALGCVVVFSFVYAILTLLPNLRLNSPCRTPLSGLTFSLFQFSALNLFTVVKAIEGIFHGLLLKIWWWSPNHGPTAWRKTLKEKVHTHYDQLLHGLHWSVERGAIEAIPRIFPSVLHWTLTLSDDKKPDDFVALMPEFFDHLATIEATSVMLTLMDEVPTPDYLLRAFPSMELASDPFLGTLLDDLLKTCPPESSVLGEEQRKSRLRVCLKCLWYCVKAYDLPENSAVPLSPYVCSMFARPKVISWIQTEEDPAIRLLGRCCWSLIAKKLANDITSRTHTEIPATAGGLFDLSWILGATSEQVDDWLGRGAIGLANFIYLASGDFEALVAGGIEGDVGDIFRQTLDILAWGIDSTHVNFEWDEDQMAQVRELRSKFADARVPEVLKDRLRYVSSRFPGASNAEGVRTENLPEPDSETPPPPGTSQNSHMGPVRIEGAPERGYAEGISTPIPALLLHGTSNFV